MRAATAIIVLPLPIQKPLQILDIRQGYGVRQARIEAAPKEIARFLIENGFKEGNDPELVKQFNDAILSMREDGTLAILQAKYIYDAGIGDPDAIEFRKFGNVDRTITVAVTGDLPPIDYVDAEGFAAGFNTAVISEIGKRLKVNINLVNIDAGARASTLASGRADAVFWIQGHRDVKKHSDIPEGITLSTPYYEWDEFFYIAPVKR